MEHSTIYANDKLEWRIRLGNLFGFPVILHLSYLLWFLGLLWMDWIDLLLFLSMLTFSILIHELAHAVISRTLGLGEGTITFFLLGGYFIPFSEELWFEMDAGRRKRYILMILAGPLSNVLLAGVFFVLAYLTTMDVLYVAARYNLILAGINLLPVGMLDGGRIFASLLSSFIHWKRGMFVVGVSAVVLSVGLLIINIWWIDGYVSGLGVLFALGLRTIDESRKPEENIKLEFQHLVDREKGFVEHTNQKQFLIMGIPFVIALLGMTAWSVCYLGYMYSVYRDLPGRFAYATFDWESTSYYPKQFSSLGFPAGSYSQPVFVRYFDDVEESNKGAFIPCGLAKDFRPATFCFITSQSKAVREMQFGADYKEIESLLLSPLNKYVALSTSEQGVFVINFNTQKVEKHFAVNGTVTTWSPDERYLLMTSGEFSNELFRIDLHSNEILLLADNTSRLSPLFSLDGKQIYYASSGVQSSSSIFRMSLDGSDAEEIVLNDAIYRRSKLRLSPDGKSFVFECDIEGGFICVVDVKDGVVKKIAEEYGPVWSPDGKYIAYTYWDGDDAHAIIVVHPDGSLPYKINYDAAIQLEWLP